MLALSLLPPSLARSLFSLSISLALSLSLTDHRISFSGPRYEIRLRSLFSAQRRRPRSSFISRAGDITREMPLY